MRARLHRSRRPRRTPEAATEAAPPPGRVGLLHGAPGPSAVLRLSRPGDGRERDADRMADAALAAPVPHRLGGVRLHTGPGAVALTRALHAEAVTVGDHIAFSPGALDTETPRGQRLLAHEAAHVAQARREPGEAPVLARRMIVGGTPDDVSALLDLLGDAAGAVLAWDPMTREVTVAGPSPEGATSSPTLASLLDEVIQHPTQDAEVVVGVNQPGIVVGGFPQPHDFTGSRTQRIDIDDVLALEAGAPGNGVAKAAHEIDENFRAHAGLPRRGDDRYLPAHEHAVEVESDIAEELVGPGRRAAEGVWQFQADGTIVSADDFETYYLVTVMRLGNAVPGTSLTPVEIVHAERVGRLVLSTETVDGFTAGAAEPPSTSAMAVAALLLQGDPMSTIRIEGHTDGVGTEARNEALGLRRAEAARDAVASEVGDDSLVGERIYVVSVGEREPAAPDDTEAGRAQNRRVVIQVDRPDYP